MAGTSPAMTSGKVVNMPAIPRSIIEAAQARPPLGVRLALRDLDAVTLLALPAILFVAALFVYPFLYGLVLSFKPKAGDWLANYRKFFSDPFLYDTIGATLWLAVPATLINVLLSVPFAMRMRRLQRLRLCTALRSVPGRQGHA